MSNEKISFSPRFINIQPSIPAYDNARIKVKFNGDFLKQEKVTYNHGPMVNIYVTYRLTPNTKYSSANIQNCLFGAVKLTKSDDIDQYKYSGYGIGFNSIGSFHIQVENMVEMLLFLELIQVVLRMIVIKQGIF